MPESSARPFRDLLAVPEGPPPGVWEQSLRAVRREVEQGAAGPPAAGVQSPAGVVGGGPGGPGEEAERDGDESGGAPGGLPADIEDRDVAATDAPDGGEGGDEHHE